MLMAAAALLRDVKFPTGEEIRERLAGHLCRCTGYEQIVRAIREAAVAEVKEL
jgi:carbon-monoxide dehydrogenase small subunit